MLWNLVLCSHTRTQCRIQIRSATVQGTQLWLPLSNSHFSRVSSSLVCAALLTPPLPLAPLPPAPERPLLRSEKNHWERTRETTKTTKKTRSDQSVKSNFYSLPTYQLLLPTLPNYYSIPVLHLAMSAAYLGNLPTKGLDPIPRVG